MRVPGICILLLIVLLPGCGLHEREQALTEREARLGRQEQALLEKENQLNLKEEVLLKKEQQLELPADTSRQDTTVHYNPDVLGTWTASMTCTETTCPGSAVGDTRTETWEFSYENNYLVAKARSGSRITRIYTGSFGANKAIELSAYVEPTRSAPATRMLVRLNPLTGNTMEGQREILREGDCKIVYALKLSK